MSVANWWSRRWESVAPELGIGAPEASVSRACRIRRLEVVAGGINASVQDRDRGVCAIEVRFHPLSDAQWERVGEVLSTQALVNTQLLSGAMPPEIEQVFADAGARLLPSAADEIASSCSCCGAEPCRHLPLVFGLFAEMIDQDPGLLFLLRGRDRQQILREVREVREPRSAPPPEDGASARPARPTAVEDGGGLWSSPDQYWGNRRLLKQFHHHIGPPEAEITLLRRLGPLNTGEESMALYEQLVTLYRRITEEALALAYAPDEPAGDERNGSN